MPIDLEKHPITLAFRSGTPLAVIEAVAIRETVLMHGGNKLAAARSLGISRSALYAKIARLGLFRSDAPAPVQEKPAL